MNIKKFNNISVNIWVVIYIILILLATFIWGYIFFTGRLSVLGVQTSNIPTPSPTPSPTVIFKNFPTITTSTPKPVRKTYVDPDPITSCTSSYPNCVGQSISLKSSQCSSITCCQIGNKWSIYADKNKCTQDQNAYYGKSNPSTSTNNSGNNSYIPPTYYPCTLYYPALHYSQYYPSLYKTKADCDSAQASLNQGTSTTQNSTPTSAPTSVPIPNQQSIEQCKSNVISNGYDDGTIFNYCNSLYGESSARDACVYIKQGQRDQLLSQCS